MASYKIYFLNFCHQNHPSRKVERPLTLQNATQKAVFIKKVISAFPQLLHNAPSPVEQSQK